MAGKDMTTGSERKENSGRSHVKLSNPADGPEGQDESQVFINRLFRTERSQRAF